MNEVEQFLKSKEIKKIFKVSYLYHGIQVWHLNSKPYKRIGDAKNAINLLKSSRTRKYSDFKIHTYATIEVEVTNV